MTRERRNGTAPVADNLRRTLTLPQRSVLHELEAFGWEIDYVRRPLFQEPRLVVRDPETARQALISEDGRVDHNPSEMLRRQSD